MCTVFPTNKQNHTRNPPTRHQPPTRNLPKRNRRGKHPRVILSSKIRRGGACVPARTSAQRRFHTKNTRIMCGEFNDECALAGRHGRAHRHRPYPSPSYFSTQSHTNKIPSMRNSPQTKSTVHVQSAPTHLHQTTRCDLTHRGYTFDSAGSASATQPTLGNGAREEATPLGVVLFLIAHHYHTRRTDGFPHAN